MRSSWKGYLKLSLVSVPVQAFHAQETGGGDIHFNQLHATCHSRIKYQKVCPIHGEVTKDEIVSGYEYAKGQYVIVEPDEIDKLRTENDRAITIDEFVAPNAIDPLYLDGRTYYLAPESPQGAKPYVVLCAAMEERKRHGIARVVFSGKEQLVLIRPLTGVLVMSMLNYDAQVRKPESIKDEVPDANYSAKELQLAEMLIDASTSKHFELSKYEDIYTRRLTELIEAKVAGREVVAPEETEQISVINLMDALKQSLGRKTRDTLKQSLGRKTRPSKTSKKTAASKRSSVGHTKRKFA